MLDLAKEISKALSEYTSEVENQLEKAKDDVTKEGVRLLKETSPEKTGDYSKGWGRKRVGTAQVIHNRTDYQLTHLLENGHAQRGGGRTAPVVHIKPVEELIIDNFEKEVERAIKG